jgi:hypothetical protein
VNTLRHVSLFSPNRSEFSMHVCANCAQHGAELLRARAALAICRAENERLRSELQDTDAAFWALAGDIRLSPIAVEVKEDFTSIIFPAEEAGGRKVS